MLLKSKKIVLRSVLPSDADILYKWENDKKNWDVSRTKKPFTKKEIEKFIADQKDIYLDKQLRLMICTPSPLPSPHGRDNRRLRSNIKGEGLTVGCIDLFKFDERNLKAGVGILIEKKYRKKGYASEALSLLIKYSFKTLNLRELFCSVSEDNEASMKLFQKQKFRVIGKKKDVYWLQLLNK